MKIMIGYRDVELKRVEIVSVISIVCVHIYIYIYIFKKSIFEKNIFENFNIYQL